MPLPVQTLTCLSRRLAWSALGISALLAGCASAPGPAGTPARSAAGATTTAADPGAWIGRWQGTGARRLDIHSLPGDGSGYQLVFRNDQGVRVTHNATASGGRLFYEGGGQKMSLRPGTGAETAMPALQSLSQCLITVPGHTGYCRRADTADALALQHGAFVNVRQECGEAAPADVLFFDGRHLSDPAQPTCQSRVVSQQGMVFGLADSCMPASGTANGFNVTVSTPDSTHVAVTPVGASTTLYRYCATGLLAPGLQQLAPR
ncbi:hypothetical protein [Salinisphaera sp. Q1T1-3]|uniref:hypothetical protein n=1 Tax=Salinisphaera sp. Q1T1-3 TaxID=2321229 RepID=UPI0011C36FDA|nr:hypothetical protein [Salinisphaera sp. Q1T1-3]